MKEANPINPLVGPVRLSWHAWRHISSQSRRNQYVFQSFQLIPHLRWIIENPRTRPNYHRLKTVKRGQWRTETRNVDFDTRLVLKGRADAVVRCVLREVIQYPVDWLAPDAKVMRDVLLESIYERKEEWPQP